MIYQRRKCSLPGWMQQWISTKNTRFGSRESAEFILFTDCIQQGNILDIFLTAFPLTEFFLFFIIFYLLIQYTFNIQTFNLHPIHEFKTYTMKPLLTFTYIYYIYIYIYYIGRASSTKGTLTYFIVFTCISFPVRPSGIDTPILIGF